MSDELPIGWENARIEDLFEFKYGKALPRETRNPHGDVNVYGSNGVVGVHDAAVTHGSTIIVGRKGSVGEVHLSPTRCWPIDTTYFIDDFAGELPPKYWALYLKSLRLGQQEKSSAIPGVSRDNIYSIVTPVPPLAEQRRIVAKLEELLAKVDCCQQRLAKVPVLLKRFRQSVLAAACSGRLTADWREEHAGTPCAAALLKRAQYKLESDELPPLPEEWTWAPLGNFAHCSRGRFSARPRNDPTYFEGQHPFVQIGDLPREGGWVLNHSQTLNERGLAVSKKFPKGTVVIAIVGATIGNTGMLGYDMCFPDSMVGIDAGTSEANRYIDFYLRSEKDKIRQSSYSSGGQPNINLEVLNSYPLALPPHAEQQEIVRRVEALFALAHAIEARLEKARAQVDKLTPALLAKAFRGELVPQDPNDEPASALLERIRAERIAATTGDAPRPRRGRRTSVAAQAFGSATG